MYPIYIYIRPRKDLPKIGVILLKSFISFDSLYYTVCKEKRIIDFSTSHSELRVLISFRYRYEVGHFWVWVGCTVVLACSCESCVSASFCVQWRLCEDYLLEKPQLCCTSMETRCLVAVFCLRSRDQGLSQWEKTLHKSRLLSLAETLFMWPMMIQV